jgi:glycosyltransferase involved in cell wall biosynthesis
VSGATAPASEAATIAARLASNLGCRTVALVGSARPSLLAPLAASGLAGFDSEDHLGYARSVLPGETWRPLEEASEGIAALDTPFVVLSTRALDELGDDRIAAILAATPAALVVDADAIDAGPDALRRRLAAIEGRGLTCLRAELIAPIDGSSFRRSSPAFVLGDGHDPRPEALVATGLNGLRLDPAVDTFSPGARPARVCIVSYEVVGPSRNGGIGTANTSLAVALGRAGHDVTLLFTGVPGDARAREHWERHFAREGVTYAELEDERVRVVGSPMINVRRSWATFEWVRGRHEQQPFDVIHGPECQGHLAHVALAKRHGVAFQDAQIVTGVHSSTRWCYESNRDPLERQEAFADEHLERTAAEASDVVVSPSGYMVAYLRSRGWQLPERTFVQQYVPSQAIRDLRETLSEATPDAADGVSEIVFFGRLEVRKGIEVFCDALDVLADDPAARRLSITFMGRDVLVRGEPSVEYIARRSARWPWAVKTMTDTSQPDAVAYLRGGGRLAVMPSLVDNSPNTVYEAIALGIPMIVSRAGGTGELIAVDDLTRCSFAGQPEDDVLEPTGPGVATRRFDHQQLVATLRGALSGAFPPVRPAVDPEANEASHLAWHAALAAGRPTRQPVAVTDVSIVVDATSGLPDAAVEALERISGEIVVAVRSEDDVPAVPDGWRVVATGQATRGHALAGAAFAATSEFLLVLPGGIVPEDGIVRTLARAAASSPADVFVYPVLDAVGQADGSPRTNVPVGGPAMLGLSYPYFGDGGFAIRTEALRAVGGFNESSVVARPMDDLLNRVALTGHRIDVVPEVLARRTTADPVAPLLTGEVWLDGVPWDAVPEERIELVRPFREAPGSDDLAALYRRSQQLVSELREQLVANQSHYAEQLAASQGPYAELAGHANWLQGLYDTEQLSGSRLRRRMTDAERHRAWSDAHHRQLRTQLEVVYRSRSWRLTAPLRALAARRRAR